MWDLLSVCLGLCSALRGVLQEGKVGVLGYFMGTECLSGMWLSFSSSARGVWRRQTGDPRAQRGPSRALGRQCSGPWA